MWFSWSLPIDKFYFFFFLRGTRIRCSPHRPLRYVSDPTKIHWNSWMLAPGAKLINRSSSPLTASTRRHNYCCKWYSCIRYRKRRLFQSTAASKGILDMALSSDIFSTYVPIEKHGSDYPCYGLPSTPGLDTPEKCTWKARFGLAQ